MKIGIIIGVIITCFIIMFLKMKNECNECNNLPKIYRFHSGKQGPTIVLIGGVHGNEISGAIELTRLVDSGFFNQIKYGSVIVIPRVNECGLKFHTRYNPYGIDYNRIYGKNSNSTMRNFILDIVKDADLVVDFHEGWSWHLIDSSSIGATITPNSKESTIIANKMINAINSIPYKHDDPRKKFILGSDKIVCDIPTTLECERTLGGHHHILVEIPGQKNIQPLWLRCLQIKTSIIALLNHFQNSQN